MGQREEQLLSELEYNARASNQQPLERRLADLTIWYYRNKERIPIDNLASKAAFLEKTIWILLEVCALQTERLHELEHRGSAKGLYLPRGLTVEGDVRKYG